ncbi:MAG: hypothetical protein R3F59_27825 [Myxococcota bacterium]
MSPEQIEEPARVDARADLYALGVVLYEAVSATIPFVGTTDYALMRRIVDGEPAPLPPAVGPLAEVIARAIRADPAERFQDAAAFAEALRPFAPAATIARVEGWAASGAGRTWGVTPSTEPPPWTAARSAPPAEPTTAPPDPEPPSALARAWSLQWLPYAPDGAVASTVGALQLASGLFDVFVMTAVQCFGLGWLGGLPACFGFVLLCIGLVEVATGLRTLITGDTSWTRRTAALELIALSAGGVLAALTGLAVLGAAKRYPTALPEPTPRRRPS